MTDSRVEALLTLLKEHPLNSSSQRCRCGYWVMDSDEWAAHVAALAGPLPEPAQGVWCLEHRKVMRNGVCPVCAGSLSRGVPEGKHRCPTCGGWSHDDAVAGAMAQWQRLHEVDEQLVPALREAKERAEAKLLEYVSARGPAPELPPVCIRGLNCGGGQHGTDCPASRVWPASPAKSAMELHREQTQRRAEIENDKAKRSGRLGD